MNRVWGLAIKTALGDVYHLWRAGLAACDSRIELNRLHREDAPTAEGPPNVRACKRCQGIARHWNDAAAERV